MAYFQEVIEGQLKSVQDEGTLEPESWEMRFKEYVKQGEFLPKEIDRVFREEKQESLELKERIKKGESLLKELESKRYAHVLGPLDLHLQLRKHVSKVKIVMGETESLPDPTVKEKVSEKFISRLKRDTAKMMNLLLIMHWEEKKEKVQPPACKVVPSPRPPKPSMKPIQNKHMIVIGGRGEDDETLRSVEGYNCVERRWVNYPIMKTERSLMSSVVVGKKILVSGGDTGPFAINDIESFAPAEPHAEWKFLSPSKSVPFSAHQMVLYRGKLIIIRGYDHHERRNSDEIYEVCLKSHRRNRVLAIMEKPVAWHGAELVGNEIFIFVGENHCCVPTDAVLAYNLATNTFRRAAPLPRAMLGMATVKIGNGRVLIVGGFDRNLLELKEFFVYNTHPNVDEGEVVCNITEMNEIIGDCSATTISSPDNHPILVVLGSASSPKTVEGYDFVKRTWFPMPPTAEERKYCSVVSTCPTEIPIELMK